MRCILLTYKLIMVGYGHQAEEVAIYVAYFKIVCAIGVERRDKGSALFHINKIIIIIATFLRRS